MGVKNNLKLILSYFALNIKKEWQYKQSFFMQIVMMVLNDLFFIIQWVIIFSIVDNIGGYGFDETMLLWAVAAGGYGFAHAFFGGAWDIKDIVYEGKLDVYLTQPKSLLINVSCSATNISAIGDMIYSFIVLAIIGAPWWWYLLMVPVMASSGLLYFSVYTTYCSLCFYIKRGDALAYTVEGTLNKAANYPPAIYGFLTRCLFFTVIPTFFYTFVPVEYLFLTFDLRWLLLFVGVVILWMALAFTLFNLGVKRYNSGSLMGGRL